jgi:hypothetical protein
MFCPLTARFAVRTAASPFDETEYGSVASPWPLRSPLSDTQPASTLADHVQSRGADIVSDPLPPVEPNEVGDPLAETWHLDDVGAVTEVSELVQAAQVAATSAATGAIVNAVR